ncbi:MAG: hypothetical protein AB7K09_07680 [Planctomycetota bacterium]
MWLFTTIGFFSVVRKFDDVDNDTLTVRARSRADLDALRATYLPALGPTDENPDRDYRFHARVARSEFVAAVARIAADIDYDNFQATVEDRHDSHRAHVYASVWDATRAIPPD